MTLREETDLGWRDRLILGKVKRWQHEAQDQHWADSNRHSLTARAGTPAGWAWPTLHDVILLREGLITRMYQY